MTFFQRLFHNCLCLEFSCKGVSGVILKCKDCGNRYAIKWEDFEVLRKEMG